MGIRSSILSRVVGATCAAGAATLLAACPAVYPEVNTPLRDVQPGQPLDPSPPSDLKWIAFKGATIPAFTRDGRRWGNELSSGLPDPYAKLLVNGSELLRTTVQRGTLKPTWDDAPAGNFRLHPDDRLRLEVWDARVINDKPIGVHELGKLDSEDSVLDAIEVETDSGVRIKLALEPAHGKIGYGFHYELRTYDAFITRLFEESPATRVGMRAGDQILSVAGKLTRSMDDGELRSAFGIPRLEPLPVSLRHADGAEVTVELKQGAVYPLFREIGTFR